METTVEYNSAATNGSIKSLGSVIPTQLADESKHANKKLKEVLGGDVEGFVANRLRMSPEELSVALATEQVDGVAFAIYNIEARGQSVIIGDQTGIGKGRQAAAMIRYGMLAGYLPIFLTDRYTLFSDMYRDCKALGIKDARPLILNLRASIVDFDKPIDVKNTIPTDEIWSPEEEADDEEVMGIYTQLYEEVYKSPKKSVLEMMCQKGDIPANCYEYVMLSYSQLKDARRDMTRLDFLTSLCENHRVLFIFDEAHKSSSVSAGNISVITQGINSILETCPKTQCVFLSATFAKRPECLITFMRQTVLSSLATNDTLKCAFSDGGVQMQEYVASMLAKEGQMIRREHSGVGIPVPIYTYLEDKLPLHAELFDKVMYWFREVVNLSEMIKTFISMALMHGASVFRPYPTRAQLFYINKILLLSLKARDVAEAAIREVRAGRSVVIGMSDTLECVLRDYLDESIGESRRGDFSTILLRLLDKTLRNPKNPNTTVFDVDLSDIEEPKELIELRDEILTYSQQIKNDIEDDIFHLPMSPIDVIRQLISQECFTNKNGVTQNIRFEECTGRAHQLEYLSPEGDDEYVNVKITPRKKRHSNHIYNDFQNNKLDVILINACGAIGASAHATTTSEVDEDEVRQRKMLIVQNDLDVNIDLQKRGRINRTGQLEGLPPLYEYIITGIPSEKRLNMMLRAKLRSLSANTTANQDQDKRQADFIDITNKYGNLVTRQFISENGDLAFVLGLSKSCTASQLLARIAMLGVSAQQDIIDEIFGAYQNLEEELRRINQWDLEREFRDFDAEFVKDELFTAPIDDAALGGASKITTFRCRHRTYPFDALSLQKCIDQSKIAYGAKLIESDKLKKEIADYYRKSRLKISNTIAARKTKLFETTLSVLLKYGLKENVAKQVLALAEYKEERFKHEIHEYLKDSPQLKGIKRKLKSYNLEIEDLAAREKKDLKRLSEERKRLSEVLSKAVIGRGYFNILGFMPVEEKIERVMAVLKEVRFGKNPDKRFLPGQIQFVFALSAIHKELALNLVEKGKHNNYSKLLGILTSNSWNFDHASWESNTHPMWDAEIARYNNRILERKIITGNILGAYSHRLIREMKPRFISFSLSPKGNNQNRTERGLLLPMTGDSVEKLLQCVALPLGDGLKYATSLNTIYQISGIGVDFSISPVRNDDEQELLFYISVDEKDSRIYESDSHFDSIRETLHATQVTSIHNKDNKTTKRPLMRYSTERISANSPQFESIISLLVSLRAVILIPREYLTVGEMKEYAKERKIYDNSNWPELDWRKSTKLPPAKSEVKKRVTSPVAKNNSVCYVDEYPSYILLCRRTLDCNGHSFKESALTAQIKSLYFDWKSLSETPFQDNCGFYWHGFAYKVADDIHKMIENSVKEPIINFKDSIRDTLQEQSDKYQLSVIGKTIKRYKEEMLFLSPTKEAVEAFLDSCLYDQRLDSIRKSLENYINGKTEIIVEA